jgi:hypothetical protein
MRFPIAKRYRERLFHPFRRLGLMAAMLLPGSLAILPAMVRKGRIEGTLTQYWAIRPTV